ncbi:MAG: hypothetical protein A2158_06340 [Chloroflexi bacterium RBG_13_46_14]|nr:MAG: hypothetical protein A2158_06340 [Chloroflexi bacterium RBG_13_46_14]
MARKIISVLNPRGIAPPIHMVPMTSRLNTLEGKTIYIVDMNFPRTHQFWEEMQKLLSGRYPGTTWELRVKTGTYFNNDPDLWAEIKEKGDGVIIGIGQLDTCTPSVIIFCSILEQMGLPTAPVVTQAFPGLTRSFAYKKGMPGLRFTFVPHPFANRSLEVHRNYLEGNDPINGRPVITGIIEALTRPTTEEEKKTGVIERPGPRLLDPDTPENLERLFLENGWTDYLPIILPTEERVAEMLKGTSHKPDEIIGRMQPIPPNEAWEQSLGQAGRGARTGAPGLTRPLPVAMQPSPPHEAWEYTVEHVAVNAVMAGAKPEHLPVILAIASTGVTSFFSSATSMCRMVVANGPIRKEINMNSGLSALGPFNQANAVIGRAWGFISRNLGGAILGETYLGDIGNNTNYNNLCCGENEEALPQGWSPLHVQKGFRVEESVVSIIGGWSLLNYAAYKPHPHHEIMKEQLTSFETSGAGTHHTLGLNPGTQATFILSPIAARDLKNEGFDSKEQLSKWIKENAFMSAWTYWAAMPDDLESARAGVEPFASWLKLPPEGKTKHPLIPSNATVEMLVVGGGTDAFWMAGDFSCMAAASVDKWR